MRKKYILLFLSLITFQSLLGQVGVEEIEEETYEEEEEEIVYDFDKTLMIGANFQLGFPLDQFGDNIDVIGWGFGGNVMWQFKRNEQLFAGIDFGYQNYDSESRITTFGFNEEYELKTKNSMVLAHLQLRIYPKVDFFIQPYFEGLFGIKSLFTRSTEKDVFTNETFNSQFDNSDYAWSVGGAVGFEIPIQKKYLFFEGRLAYLKGTSADYYARRPGNPNYINPLEVFELKNSATDLLMPQIGIKFLIGFSKNSPEEYEEDNYESDEY